MFLDKNVPACGFALGLERILLVMAERNMYPASLATLDAVLAVVSDASRRDALRLAAELRRTGLRVDLRPNPMSPGKLSKNADEHGARAAVWIEGELSGRASLWTRSDGQTRRDLLPAEIAAHLAAAESTP